MNQNLIGTHLLLVQWGRWGRPPNIGLPSMSPMFGERTLKTPMHSFEEPEQEVAKVDTAILRLPAPNRKLLIQKYQWNTPAREYAQQERWTTGQFYRRLNRSLWMVKDILEDMR